jgi:tetratricopeptide (TPR) repeat protein
LDNITEQGISYFPMSKQRKKQSKNRQKMQTSPISVHTGLEEAKVLLDKNQYQDAIRLLGSLAERYPRSAEVHTLLGSAFVNAGEFWNGVIQYEEALALGRNAPLLVSLGFVYLRLELKVLALQAFRQALKSGLQEPLVSEIREGIHLLESELQEVAYLLDQSSEHVEKGLRFMEEGQIALQRHDYSRSIHLNRKAIRFLGGFLPPHNNLSLSLFFHGEPEEAIRTARTVAAWHPDNIQALSNLVRYLAWTGKMDEALQVWAHLKSLTPHDHTTRMKMVEAATIMDADEEVYRLLQEKRHDEELDREFTQQEQFFLAVAEANTGRKTGRRRLKGLQDAFPWVKQILEALQSGKRGLGWADRFPYYHASELLPQRELNSFLDLLSREGKMPAAKFQREVERFAARFPQLVLFGKKVLLEDQQTEPAIALLKKIGTPEAYEVLREFGLSQTGDDESRLKALFALSEQGQFAENETVRFWQQGEWREIKLKKYEIVEGREQEYSPKVIALLNKALLAFNENRFEEAEGQYQRILVLEPRAKEAYNNLGTVFARQEKNEQAQAMFQKAIEIDPLYVMPRCNLAMYLLGDEKVEEAEAMIAPLVDVPKLQPQEMVFLSYVRARIYIEQGEYDQARNMLEVALDVIPDYELAKGLLDRLTTIELMNKGWKRIFESQHQRNLSRRERQRSQLTTTDPWLADALSVYTKEILTAIARNILPWGGWSSFKKAELHQYLVDYLLKEGSLARVLDSLTPEERTAFELVQANGGTLPWEIFDQKFGNDLKESPSWQYHEPESVMGRLRAHGLLFEVKVEEKLLLIIPIELRKQMD